jgi:hypothetical protein
MPARVLAGAMCVQRFDDSLNSAIRITYRISLRSSSMPEPRDPLLKVLIHLFFPPLRERGSEEDSVIQWSFGSPGGRLGPGLAAFARPAPGAAPPKQREEVRSHGVWELVNSVMIPPLVHQRRPCYDFYFL